MAVKKFATLLGCLIEYLVGYFSQMLFAYLSVFLCFQAAIGQQQPSSRQFPSRDLDSLLQGYAFRAFVRPRTGIVYEGSVPSNLTGIRVAALRLRSGSLRRRGFVGYREFDIPVGISERPYAERLVLVYHNLGNWSSLYYPLPGYTFLAPVLGILAYDAADLTAADLPELDIRASGDPILVNFSDIALRPNPMGMCVYFGLDGSVVFDHLVNSTCSATTQGHFSIVVQSVIAPAPAPATAPRSGGGGGEAEGRADDRRRVWIIVGSVVGGALLVVVSGVVLCYLGKCRRRKKIRRMEEEAESGVPLPMANVGRTKAPVAMEIRTRPMLENEFVP